MYSRSVLNALLHSLYRFTIFALALHYIRPNLVLSCRTGLGCGLYASFLIGTTFRLRVVNLFPDKPSLSDLLLRYYP